MGKPRKLAAKLIRKDKDKLLARDLLKIQRQIENRTGSRLKLGQIADVAKNRTDKTIGKNLIRKARQKRRVDERVDRAESALEKAESKVKKIPSGADGRDKPFSKYKPQPKKIEAAAEAKLDLKRAEGSEPKTLKGTGKILKDFRAGRRDRRKEIRGLEKKVERPDFEKYEQEIEKIRKGKGKAAKFAYSTRFKNLGKEFGIEYGDDARRERTKSRLRGLKLGLTGAYDKSDQSREKRRQAGRDILKSMSPDKS